MLLVLCSSQGQAQFFRKLADKAIEASERTVTRKIEEKSEKTTGDAVDKTINGKKGKSDTNNSGTEDSKSKKGKSEKKTKEVTSAKDFVAGDKVLVFEDFSQDAIGDFPVNWLTNSSGEVVTISNTPQRWLKLSNKGTFTITDVKQLPENFTLEFEVYINEGAFSFYSTYLNIGFIESKKKNDYTKWEEYGQGKEGVIMKMFPTIADAYNDGKMGTSKVMVISDGEEILKNELQTPTFNYTNNNQVKVQMWRQKNRLRMYIAGKKVWDLPNAFQEVKYNAIVFYIHEYQNENDKYHISNFRLAQASGDKRHKLLETGSFSTNEILFDTAKATIKPSSAAILADLGKVLQENPNIKVSITGHTDGDGDSKKNLILSEQRAMAVKTELVRKFNLNEDNIQVMGQGEANPVADNKTEEGKKQNRRVEFKIIK